MTGDDHGGLVTAFIQQVWNDTDMAWAKEPARLDALVHPDYRPGHWRTLHWSAPWAVERSAGEWLERQVAPYRFEYPDFEVEVRELLRGGEGGEHLAADLDFNGHHVSRTFTTRGGGEAPESRWARGVGWTLVRDGRIARFALFWEGGGFLNPAE